MADKVLVSVAPVRAADHKIDPKKIAADVVACAKAGAAMVHLHVRDNRGNLTSNLDVFRETVELIREQSDIIIQASTGGVSNLSIKERCAPLYESIVETCSLNVGSTNLGEAVYSNPIPEVKYCVKEIIKTGKVPEIEVFEIGHTHMVQELRKEFPMKNPILFSIVLGHPGEAPATPEALMAMVNFIPGDAIWGITHAHRTDFGIIAGALGLGAKTVRIGFEDSCYLNPTTTVETNLPLVQKTVALLHSMDKQAMTAEEAREMLHLEQLSGKCFERY